MQRARLFCLVALVLLTAAALGAQTISKEDQLTLQAPTFSGATGLFDIVTGDTLKRGDWSFSTYFNEYTYLAGHAPELQPPSTREGQDMDYLQSEFTASIGYGLTDRWELTLGMPYVTLDQNAGDLAGYINGYPYAGKFTENDIGNLRVATKFGLVNSDTNKLALSAFWDVNTGHEDSGIATGRPEYGAGLHWTSGMVTASAGYFMRPDRRAITSPEGLDFEMSDEINLGVALNYPLSHFSPTSWITELNSTVYTGGERAPDDLVEIGTGIRHWFGDSGWGMSALVRSNLTIATSSNADGVGLGYGFGVHYAPTHLGPVALPPPPAPVPVPEPPPPAPAPVEPPPEPVAAPRAPQEILSTDIMFDEASARLTNIAKAQLDDVALRMKSEPAATAMVSGYTDGTEKTGEGNDLDRRRAEAVRDYLVSRHGIDASRITTEAKGTGSRSANVKLIVP
ncbi:MAG: OmpA family protein [Acidobacteria bacterium]|nr:OmpA family protein [Acidobacteriota bacterium]